MTLCRGSDGFSGVGKRPTVVLTLLNDQARTRKRRVWGGGVEVPVRSRPWDEKL